MKRIILTIFLTLTFFSFFNIVSSKTATKQSEKKIKILLVPGHDDEVWGAEYGNIKEADMNLQLALELQKILKKDKRFDVYITRTSGKYTKVFSKFFSNKDAIMSFKNSAKKEMLVKVEEGDFVKVSGAPHQAVNQDTSLKLYGINKWANDNKMDAVIHIHFNDYARSNKWEIGDRKGFNLYVPDEQLVNSKLSTELANSIFTQLKKKYSVSNYVKEKEGIVPDQKLIALGANGSLNENVRSVLVEYGYIYRFANSKFRHKAYKNMASLTATGIKNYFFNQ